MSSSSAKSPSSSLLAEALISSRKQYTQNLFEKFAEKDNTLQFRFVGAASLQIGPHTFSDVKFYLVSPKITTPYFPAPVEVVKKTIEDDKKEGGLSGDGEKDTPASSKPEVPVVEDKPKESKKPDAAKETKPSKAKNSEGKPKESKRETKSTKKAAESTSPKSTKRESKAAKAAKVTEEKVAEKPADKSVEIQKGKSKVVAQAEDVKVEESEAKPKSPCVAAPQKSPKVKGNASPKVAGYPYPQYQYPYPPPQSSSDPKSPPTSGPTQPRLFYPLYHTVDPSRPPAAGYQRFLPNQGMVLA